MKKLYNTIMHMYDFGKLPKGITPAEAFMLPDIYSHLAEHKETRFVQSGIRSLLESCGIKTRLEGIGYVAYLE